MKKNCAKHGSGVLILFLVFLILLTGLFLLEEIKNKSLSFKLHKEGPIEKHIKTEEKKLPAILPGKLRGAGQIALILDDVGWNPDITNHLKKIQIPITLAILPDSPFGYQIAKQMANKPDVELLLHIPLEPENLNSETKIATGFLTTSMENEELKEKMDGYLKKFEPYIVGINHHMGSKFTADQEKMAVILEEIKEKKLVYVDSLTSKNSVGYTLARQMGIKTGKRDVFIDNSNEPDQISRSLEKALLLAKENGTAIVIGHARITTLKFLEDKIPEIKNEGYTFIPITKALK
ncbi:MAG TPA: divergent polysaccharide deacetylase family protein [bacterium]|nr:divergent polysaccharide deacetylase family protein [bacterium]HOL35381.1 divergent polysaccharide deacetylase family protein [bacterium]HPP09214.1 divergent polysaccharide deacetylase family protein [bacterium]